MTAPPFGIVEGYFGRPWSWTERTDTMRALAPHGYATFLYAPKADAWLRRRWREPHPEADLQALADFGGACRAAGVRFGVGLSPFEAYLDFDAAAQEALAAKLSALDGAGIDDLAILFDDMKGDLPDLAARQARIVEFAASRTRATRLLMCPTYYSDDPVLDRAFGQRPGGYLEALGVALDPAVAVFWTGEEVCAREIGPGHLDAVAERLRRLPTLWDNYPVNDGPRMSQHLHLRAFTGRPATNAVRLAGHFVNPALQPVLTRIPAATLAMSYARGEAYAYGAAFREAAEAICGRDLAAWLEADLLSLDDAGLGAHTPDARARLRARYAAFDHPAAREVVGFLDGDFTTLREEVLTS